MRLLDYDPESGMSTWHEYDADTDTTYIREVQDAEPFLEANRALLKEDDYRKRGVANEWLHIARIPVGVIAQLHKERGVDVYDPDHWPAVRRILNDPEWEYLRVTRGTV